jgi:MoaA/NifB/PqqE/SkfB family radical SAM enzyme
MKRVNGYLSRRRLPKLDWIQLEITSHCNANCVYCPHSEFRGMWHSRRLSLETLRHLIPSLENTEHIHLQGWGEPFTHPDLLQMLTLCKRAGCVVSTTTNGSLLTPDCIEEVVVRGMDIIAFSLAGVDEESDSVRRGNSIDKALGAIDHFHRLKAKYGVDRPKIHVAFMLLRSGLGALDKLPEFLGNLGIDQVVISSLSLIVRKDLEEESLISMGIDEYSELSARLIEMRNKCRKLGVDVFFHLASPRTPNQYCPENIEKALFIGSDGSVSPCVMANIPVAEDAVHYFRGTKTRLGKIIFGNIADQKIVDIWRQKEYKKFRKSFSRVHRSYNCSTCAKLRIDNLPGDSQQ